MRSGTRKGRSEATLLLAMESEILEREGPGN
jgi:hypothetical protein